MVKVLMNERMRYFTGKEIIAAAKDESKFSRIIHNGQKPEEGKLPWINEFAKNRLLGTDESLGAFESFWRCREKSEGELTGRLAFKAANLVFYGAQLSEEETVLKAEIEMAINSVKVTQNVDLSVADAQTFCVVKNESRSRYGHDPDYKRLRVDAMCRFLEDRFKKEFRK